MSKLGASGDTKLTWTKGDKKSVASAKKTFEDLKAKGYSAFAVESFNDVDGKTVDKRGRRVDAFDADLEEIVLVPQAVGG